MASSSTRSSAPTTCRWDTNGSVATRRPLAAVPRHDLHHAAVVGLGDRRSGDDASELEQRLERLEPTGAVVVAGHDHHSGAGGRQVEQGSEDDLLGLGGRRLRLEQVTHHQDGVDALGAGDRTDLGQHGLVLGRPAAAADRATHVPVGGVQELHGSDGTEGV